MSRFSELAGCNKNTFVRSDALTHNPLTREGHIVGANLPPVCLPHVRGATVVHQDI